MTWVMAVPSTVPSTLTAPPISRVPPSTGARKDGSRKPSPTPAEKAPLLAESRNPASPASRPDSACAWIVRSRTGMPDSSAALALEPAISTSRPVRDHRNSSPTTRTATSAIGASSGISGPHTSPAQ